MSRIDESEWGKIVDLIFIWDNLKIDRIAIQKIKNLLYLFNSIILCISFVIVQTFSAI